ncbi:MAG: DUF898 family protein [Pseudomonadota bacterium]
MSFASLDNLDAQVVGNRGDLLGLAIKTTFLTVITCGIYSFWSRTRIRRWLWSTFHVGGAPLEYRGRPMEKLMGFVIAACIVATYLGIVVMVLIFLSLNIFNNILAGIVASIICVLPVYWFARYRGMQYLMNHTEWRGLSFSMAPGAWGHARLASTWTVITLMTAGLALPWRTHHLWKYRVDRTFYGDTPFRLDNSAWPLARAWLPNWLGLVACTALWAAALASFDPTGPVNLPVGTAVLITVSMPIAALWLWVRWRVRSYERLISAVQWGDGVRMTVAPKVGRIVVIHLGGWIIVGALLLGALIGVGMAFGFLAFGGVVLENLEQEVLGGGAISPYILFGGGLLIYLAFFLLRGTFRLAFVTFPLIRHVGETLAVSGAAEVGAAKQGARQHMADADGFANLFDLGAGI